MPDRMDNLETKTSCNGKLKSVLTVLN